MRHPRLATVTAVGMALMLVPSPFSTGPARAESRNFEWSGKIYTKWLYRNNDRAGVVSLGNPFWPDNISGDNGVASELDLSFIARVGEFVQAGARIQSRFGGIWQDWWENGDIRYDEENTSGE